jgi:hypothetical protein
MSKVQKVEVSQEKLATKSPAVISPKVRDAGLLNPLQSSQRLKVYLQEKAGSISHIPKPSSAREVERYDVAKQAIDQRLTLAQSLV